MARTIGTVKSISGKAAVKTLNDQLHVLKVGEALHENEMVYALGADSKVTLTLEGGRELTLNGYDEILLDKSVFTALEEGETLDVKALQQALAEALNPENMEETAAGNEVVGEANAGADFTERNDARGNPSSYLTGTEISALDVTLDPNEEGVENAAPVALDDEGTAIEGSNLDEMPNTLVGNVLSNDTDDSLPNPPADLDVVGVVSNDSTNAAQLIDNHYVLIGKYGTLILNAETGEYTYTVDDNNEEVDALNIGKSVSETFGYTISDGEQFATATLKITIEGSNDAPVAKEDTAFLSEDDLHPFLIWHPTLTIDALDNDTDVDSGDLQLVSVSVVGGIQNGFAWVDTYTNTIKYIPNWMGNQSMNEGDIKTVLLNYTISDDMGATSSSTVTITITGENDQAYIIGDDRGYVKEDIGVEYENTHGGHGHGHGHSQPQGFLQDSGRLFALDVDEGESRFNTNVTSHNTLGTLTIDTYGNWEYSVDNSLVQYLGEGDKLYEYFTVHSIDGTDSETIKITITGTNDVARITGDDNGSVKEDWHMTSAGFLRDTGSLHISDADQGEAKFSTAVLADSNNIGGNLTIDQYGHWNYSISNSLVQYLSAGEKMYEYFTVKSLDGTDLETIQITITGTNDAPIARADSGSTDVTTHTTTVYYAINAGNDYTDDGVTITPINGISVDRSGPTMGVVGPHSSSQMIDPEQSHLEKVGKHDWKLVVDAEEEGVRFVFDHNIKNAVIDFGNFSQHDTASWAIYNAANQKIAFGTYTNNGNPNNSILTINSIHDFNRIEIINSDDNHSFTIDHVIATGSAVSSITSGSLLYFTESDLLSNDSEIDHLDTLNITSVSNTSTLGAVISLDNDGNILYNPNDALDSITQMTYDTFNYTISDGHGGMSTATVTVALTPLTTSEAYDGQTLLIESGNNIDFSNIAALSNNFSQIDLKNGDVSLINVSPENVDNASENGTLVINGEAADSITLTGAWSAPVTADGYTTYTASVDSNLITLHVETEIIP